MHKVGLTIGFLIISTIVAAQKEPPQRRWYIPDFAMVQFAGDVGMISGGVGFQSPSQKRNYMFSVGYLPKMYVDKKSDLFTLNPTFQYKLFFLNFKEINVRVAPLVLGIGGSISLGENFTKYYDSNYPQGYYWWPNNFRIILSVGHSGYIRFPQKHSVPFKAMEFYSQLTTNDLALYSYSENTIVKFKHIVHFACGVKLYLFL